MTVRLNLVALVALLVVVLGACADERPTLTVGADSAPTEELNENPLDAPMPPTVAPEDITEYEQFRWQTGVVDGYVMTYTQKCGDLYRADDPTTTWIEGEYFGNPIDSDTRPNSLLTIPELLEVVIARSSTDTLVSFIEGDLGQPEQILIEGADGERIFCFELLRFQGSTADGDGRMPVPLLYEASAASRESSEFGVGVASCNGNPTFTMIETDGKITVNAVSWVPSGDGRDDCLDGVSVQLDAPIGERQIVDGLSGRTVPLMTDADLYAPKPLTQIDCYEDAPDCRANFQVGPQTYSITCIGVADAGITDYNFAAGEIDGGTVNVFQIKSVGVNIMLAVDMTSGDCSERAVGPIEGVEHAWSVAVLNGADVDQRSRFLCSLADLSDEQRAEERCERFDQDSSD